MERTDGMVKGRDFEEVAQQFRSWRANRVRGERIPKRLWQAAAELSERHAVEEIASTLALNSERLEKRVEVERGRKKHLWHDSQAPATGGGFIEVGTFSAGYPDECTVEAEDGAGKKLTVHLRGDGCAHAIEIATRVAKALWNTGR
jgi:hypothetical protein